VGEGEEADDDLGPGVVNPAYGSTDNHSPVLKGKQGLLPPIMPPVETHVNFEP